MTESGINPGKLLEQRFGFSDLAFETYMAKGSIKDTSPSRLGKLAEEMAAHEHPVVQYAAGWAYAERGLYRHLPKHTRSNESPDLRLQAFSKSDALWRGVIPGLRALRNNTSDAAFGADLWGLEIRARQARSHLPTMRLVARLRGGETVPAAHIERGLLDTRRDTTAVARAVLRFGREERQYHITRAGLRNELVTGLLLQRMQPLTHFVIAASMRQDNHRLRGLRADLMAVAAQPPYGSTRIGISGDEELWGDARLNVFASADLPLSPGQSIWGTLEALVRPESTDTKRRLLDERTEYLSARLREAEEVIRSHGRPPESAHEQN
jgi:hypothetical protein